MNDYPAGDEGVNGFEAPPYTILSREVDARGMLITTMIIDEELCEFEAPVGLHDQVAMIAAPEMRIAKQLLDSLSKTDEHE